MLSNYRKTRIFILAIVGLGAIVGLLLLLKDTFPNNWLSSTDSEKDFKRPKTSTYIPLPGFPNNPPSFPENPWRSVFLGDKPEIPGDWVVFENKTFNVSFLYPEYLVLNEDLVNKDILYVELRPKDFNPGTPPFLYMNIHRKLGVDSEFLAEWKSNLSIAGRDAYIGTRGDTLSLSCCSDDDRYSINNELPTSPEEKADIVRIIWTLVSN